MSDIDRQEPIEALVIDEPVRPPHPHLGWAILWTLLLLGVQVVLGGFIAVVGLIVGLIDMEGTPPDPIFVVIVFFAATATTVLVALALVSATMGRQVPRLVALGNAAPQQWLWALLILPPLMILASEVSNWAAEVLPVFAIEQFELLSRAPLVLVFVAGCLMPGIGEELYFRGFLSRGLIGHYGVWIGSILASLLFALVHFYPVQVCATFAVGLGLQFVFLMTRSLLVPIVLHAANNSTAFLLMRYQKQLYLPGITTLETKEEAAQEAAKSAVVSEPGLLEMVHTPLPIVLAASVAFVLLAMCLYQSRTRWVLPDGSWWQPPYPATELPPPELQARSVRLRPHLWLIVTALLACVIVTLFLWAAARF